MQAIIFKLLKAEKEKEKSQLKESAVLQRLWILMYFNSNFL